MEGVDAAFWFGVTALGLAGVAGVAWRVHHRAAQAQRRSRTDLAVLESAVDALTRRVAMLEQQLRAPAVLAQELKVTVDATRIEQVPEAVESIREGVPSTREAVSSIGEFMASNRAAPLSTRETKPIERLGAHGTAPTLQPITPWIPTPSASQSDATAVDIEGLARRIDAIRSRPIDEAPAAPPEQPTTVGTLPHRDDLTLIDGIDAAVEKALNDAGFRFYRDIVAAKPEELAWALAAAGPILAGTPTDHWQAQARRLAGREDAQRT